jgi:N-acetylmuramoyl-L-alanine amidase/peptidoglycan hydrolase-like protein with peptidoglycan-binding domain
MKAFLMHPLSRTIIAVALIGVIIVPLSSVFARSSKTVEKDVQTQAQIREKYTATASGGDKVRVLVMPGHEPDFGGALYQGVYEREIVVEIADQLASYLKKDQGVEVIVARSNTAWNADLEEYFDDEWDEIEDFVSDKKKEMKREIRRGDIEQPDTEEQVDHAAAPTDVALRLYGINKWANENDIDFVVHLHVNDTTDHGPDEPSAYTGYTIYVPDSQFENADTSRALAESIVPELSSMYATSTLPIEDKGIAEDQELIAIGANKTLSVPSILIEYGYITEPRFLQPEFRSHITNDYALQTYRGIETFLGGTPSRTPLSAALPFTFASSSLAQMGSSSPGTYALQAGLRSIGVYPTHATTTPANAKIAPVTLTMCPIDGVMSDCTVNAIEAYQLSKGFPTTGALGPRTVTALNMQFSNQPQASIVPVVSTVPVATATSTPTTTVSVACVLPVGTIAPGQQDKAVGGDVSKLQALLSQDPTLYPQKLVTGYYGTATQAAVQTFQSTQGVLQKGDVGYGFVGPKTKEALKAQYCK